ncbi:hypothetical protein MIR68_004796 [Amoeboaphelidium protococcarum]|nr:hypothetical protein MIR68_004796 [Amoeboaphelidium protococcarum]
MHPKHESFLDTLSSIIDQSSNKVNDGDNVILSKKKELAYAIDDSKLEQKAKALMRRDKLSKRDRDHVLPNLEYDSEQKDRLGWRAEYEKVLRKTSTRGVIKLFNAIKTQRDAQKQVVKQISRSKSGGSKIQSTSKIVKNADKAKLASASKEAFLQYLKKDSAAVKSASSPQSQSKSNHSETPKWSALNDNYMTDAKIQDWDDI